LSKKSWVIRKSAPASTLRLQVLEIGLGARSFGWLLGIAGAATQKSNAADVGDELGRVDEAARGARSGSAARRVTAQGDHVLDPAGRSSVEHGPPSSALVAPTQVRCAIASMPTDLLDAPHQSRP
jgi:hypothetical protein